MLLDHAGDACLPTTNYKSYASKSLMNDAPLEGVYKQNQTGLVTLNTDNPHRGFFKWVYHIVHIHAIDRTGMSELCRDYTAGTYATYQEQQFSTQLMQGGMSTSY